MSGNVVLLFPHFFGPFAVSMSYIMFAVSFSRRKQAVGTFYFLFSITILGYFMATVNIYIY